MKNYVYITLFFLLTCLCFFGSSEAQTAKNKTKDTDVFSSVPKETREQLRKRLQVLILFQKTKKYEELYELLSEDTKQQNSKESFVKVYRNADEQKSKFDLSRFTPDEVYSIYPDYWMVIGCGEYLDAEKEKRYESHLIAVYENNDWYFGFLINASHRRPIKKCSMRK